MHRGRVVSVARETDASDAGVKKCARSPGMRLGCLPGCLLDFRELIPEPQTLVKHASWGYRVRRKGLGGRSSGS